MKKRASGILMHISSLPGPYGIGDFGKGAYEFVDFLRKANTRYWQILPLGITGYGDSPYQSFSAFAGNPYFIDLDHFVQSGYLEKEEIAQTDLGDNPESVDFGKLYEHKMPLLIKAYDRSKSELNEELKSFLNQEDWLWDFALFMAIKTKFGGKSWQQWPEDYKKRDQETLAEFAKGEEEEIYFWIFTQYFFFKQWVTLKQYANESGIKIVGDIPIYVAEDGSDIWAQPEMFVLDEDLVPTFVAGVPPDAFSADGQLWGNPLYDWEQMKQNGFSWWIKRIRESFRIYDTVRIDHFRGFESYWQVPAGALTAASGQWVKGPSMDLFKAINHELGEQDIMAENLGFLTDEVDQLIKDTGFPGMNIMIFGIDAKEDSSYLPHNYIRNSVVYTTNHDSQTVEGFMKTATKENYNFAVEYLNINKEAESHEGFLRGAWSSVSYLAIAPIQDLLGLDDSARFNVPSTLGENWKWRMAKGALTEKVTNQLSMLNEIYRR